MSKTNVAKLKSIFDKHEVDGFIIPSTDEFMNEYVPEQLNRLKFATGFTGSNGVAIITRESNVLFTDSRYLIQAKEELSEDFIILNMYEKASCQIYSKLFTKGLRLGYDPYLHDKANLDYYKKITQEAGAILVEVQNLIDEIWHERPNPDPAEIYRLDVKYAGLTQEEKITQVLQKLGGRAEHLLVCKPDMVCWLLNIRSSDIKYNPLLLSRLILSINGKIQLFVDDYDKRADFELPHTEVYSLAQINAQLEKIKGTVAVVENSTPLGLLKAVKNPVYVEDIVTNLKAIKNPTELRGFRKAHLDDGISMIKALHWLFTQRIANLTEYDVARQIDKFRTDNLHCIGPSFASIVGYKENGAIVHYNPYPKNCKEIGDEGLLLIDSGGQYFNGTTDVTRTVHLGVPKEEEKFWFTKVLKGHIRLAVAVFPHGINGAHLDSLARLDLWQNAYDYGHGTGHGIGHFSSVHEGPQRISRSCTNQVALEDGMVLSNEPGYYEEGKFGIRIENVMIVREFALGYHCFETVTLIPIQGNLINAQMLTQDELAWINGYNADVIKKVGPHLTSDERVWIENYILIA